ncbi:MAG: hydroxymethylbilane synthase [bacterium]
MTHDSHRVIIGSHCSNLAQAQARWVGIELRRASPQVKVEYAVVSSATVRASALREIEDALLGGKIDVALHGANDLPYDWRAGSVVVAVPTREMPFDVLVAAEGMGFEDLPRGARVGTRGVHRRAQILSQRSDLSIVEMPAEAVACIAKIDGGELHALVMSGAELEWLGLAERVSEIIMSSVCLPCPGQGAVALRAREKDSRSREIASVLDDPVARATIEAECACVRALGGGLEIPVAAYCEAMDDALALEGLIASANGRRLVRDSEEGEIDDAAAIGAALGKRLLADGGEEILRSIG